MKKGKTKIDENPAKEPLGTGAVVSGGNF